jgi:uncharacterized protein YdaU (DUF1376 family)
MGQKPPAFQFYVKDWMTSPTVLRMTHAERGIYVWLLCVSWNGDEPGTLPLPLQLTARCAGLDTRVVKNFLRKYPNSFQKQGNHLINHKLAEQWRDFLEFQEKKRLAANVRWHGPTPSTVQTHNHVQSPASASAFASATKDLKPTADAQKPRVVRTPQQVEYGNVGKLVMGAIGIILQARSEGKPSISADCREDLKTWAAHRGIDYDAESISMALNIAEEKIRNPHRDIAK